MTEAQAGEAILQHWRTQWAALHPEIPTSYDDEVFSTVEEWVRVTIVEADRANAAIGGARLANTGYIGVSIFTKPLAGAQRSRELAGDARSILENKTIASPIANDEPVCVYEGKPYTPTTDGAWAQRLLRFAYRWDET